MIVKKPLYGLHEPCVLESQINRGISGTHIELVLQHVTHVVKLIACEHAILIVVESMEQHLNQSLVDVRHPARLVHNSNEVPERGLGNGSTNTSRFIRFFVVLINLLQLHEGFRQAPAAIRVEGFQLNSDRILVRIVNRGKDYLHENANRQNEKRHPKKDVHSVVDIRIDHYIRQVRRSGHHKCGIQSLAKIFKTCSNWNAISVKLRYVVENQDG
mmetsp:Transcript_2776/g.6572  ORF Transcript_2776/g.6572 Transcript_2776/m.6572 type:complete len:215 (-) Transcript_2776:792-1436(-)